MIHCNSEAIGKPSLHDPISGKVSYDVRMGASCLARQPKPPKWPCNDLDRISNLVGQTKSYSGGKIRIAHVDTDGEPACCSSHLLVFIPSPAIGSQCFAVSQKAVKGSEGQLGFNGIEFNRIKAAYDPHRGLLLNVPYTLYNPDRGRGKPGNTNVLVDLRGKGSVRIVR
jgi:hypothetical protein